jgi:uncharacterized damage-inducible protein DinB
MFTKEGIRQFHAWTHESLDLVIQHAAKMPAGLFTREVPGFGYATVRNQLVHLLVTEAGWIRRLQSLEPVKFRNEDHPTPESLVEAKRAVMATTLAYLDALEEEQFNAELEKAPESWAGPPASPAFILHHILTHAFHHKGQIVAMFRFLGHPAPDTDLQRVP